MPRFLIAALLVLTLGCGGDTVAPADSIYDTYTLRSVNGGQSLPWAQVEDARLKFEVTGATFTLNSDGTARQIVHRRDTVHGTVISVRSDTLTGTFTHPVAGKFRVILGTIAGNVAMDATVESGTLTVVRDIYTR